MIQKKHLSGERRRVHWHQSWSSRHQETTLSTMSNGDLLISQSIIAQIKEDFSIMTLKKQAWSRSKMFTKVKFSQLQSHMILRCSSLPVKMELVSSCTQRHSMKLGVLITHSPAEMHKSVHCTKVKKIKSSMCSFVVAKMQKM